LPVLGCNLWSGASRIATPRRAVFADTDFVGTDGTLGGRYASAKALADTVAAQWTGKGRTATWCCRRRTLLQVDTALIEALHMRLRNRHRDQRTIEPPDAWTGFASARKPAPIS